MRGEPGLLPGRASRSCDPRGTQDGLQGPQTQALTGHPRAEPGHPRGLRPCPVCSAWVPPTQAVSQGALPLCPRSRKGGRGSQDGLNLSSASGQPRPGGPRASPGPRSGVEASPNFHSPSEHCGPSWEPPPLSGPPASDPPRGQPALPLQHPGHWATHLGTGAGHPEGVAAGRRWALACGHGDSEGGPLTSLVPRGEPAGGLRGSRGFGDGRGRGRCEPPSRGVCRSTSSPCRGRNKGSG